jgi:glutathione S-transferase
VGARAGGDPYELELVSKEGESGERRRARHPLGRVPMLEDDDGRVLFESSAICLHAAELAPGADLIAVDRSFARALTYRRIFFVMTEVEPPALTARRARAVGDAEDESALRAVARGLEAVEATLSGRDHILGESFSVADVVVCEITRMPGSLEVGEPRARLLAYFGPVAARPARERAVARIDTAGKPSRGHRPPGAESALDSPLSPRRHPFPSPTRPPTARGRRRSRPAPAGG